MKEHSNEKYTIKLSELLSAIKNPENFSQEVKEFRELINSHLTPKSEDYEYKIQFLEVVKGEKVKIRIELLEKIETQSENRLLEHSNLNRAGTWATKWVAFPIAYLFPKKRREEWLGDLCEANFKMLYDGYPRWMINLNNIIRTAILLISSLKIKLSDFISLGLGKIK